MKTFLNLFSLLLLIQLNIAKLVVYGPEALLGKFDSNKPVIRASYANFGHIPYGQSLIGSIFYDENNPDGCKRMDVKKPEDTTEPQFDEEDEPDEDENDRRRHLGAKLNRNLASSTATEEQFPTKILLVDRGQCHFVNKVRNAERAGASLVVVIDNVYENITNVIMGDDGTGTGIRIPSMIIGKEDGEILKEFAKTGETATLSAEFAVKALMEKVDVDLFFSSNNQKALTFIKEFAEYAPKLQGYIDFHPRYVTWGCPGCADDFKETECFTDGAYCAPNHSKSQFDQAKGTDILLENLRETCLHKSLSEKDNEGAWWEYMKNAHMECYKFISQKCSKVAVNMIGESWLEVQNCVTESFDQPGYKGNNTFLYENSRKWIDLGTMYWPMITMNNMTFRGDLTADNILEDICANLVNRPQVCLDYYESQNIEFNSATTKKINVISAEMLIIIVSVLILVNIILICAYRRCVKREMDENMNFRVSSAVSQYISLAQQNRTNNSVEID